MACKSIIYLLFIASFFIIQITNGSELEDSRSITDTIVALVKKEIEKLMNLVKSIVDEALHDLDTIKNTIIQITKSAIKLATDAINSVIDNAIDTIRQIAEDAMDAGLNITECYVDSVDQLTILRRRLLADEVTCATSQLSAFNEIIDGAVKNFTDDLTLIGELPKRLQECLTNINAIKCVTDIVTDVAALQKDIPQQILGTMARISDYMVGFEQRVHKCQFDELRVAIEESRKVIDGVRYCAREAQNTTTLYYT